MELKGVLGVSPLSYILLKLNNAKLAYWICAWYSLHWMWMWIQLKSSACYHKGLYPDALVTIIEHLLSGSTVAGNALYLVSPLDIWHHCPRNVKFTHNSIYPDRLTSFIMSRLTTDNLHRLFIKMLVHTNWSDSRTQAIFLLNSPQVKR